MDSGLVFIHHIVVHFNFLKELTMSCMLRTLFYMSSRQKKLTKFCKNQKILHCMAQQGDHDWLTCEQQLCDKDV